MLFVVQRTLLRLEGKAPRKDCEVADLWQGYEGALATLGMRIAIELRGRGKTPSLSFFALRLPKDEFEVPEWLI